MVFNFLDPFFEAEFGSIDLVSHVVIGELERLNLLNLLCSFLYNISLLPNWELFELVEIYA